MIDNDRAQSLVSQSGQTKSGECINWGRTWSVGSSGNLLILVQLSMIGRISEEEE